MRTTWRDKFPKSMLTDPEAGQAVQSKLLEILNSVHPLCSSTLYSDQHGAGCDEVYPSIFLGDGATAKNKKFLKKIGITHIVNTAMGESIGMVNTSAVTYADSGIKFLGVRMMDLPSTPIADYFDEVAGFIDEALAANGKVYIHCLMGISRSATCVIAFMMLKRGFSAEEALRHVRERRFVSPNTGFITQLAHLDVKLGERSNQKKLCDPS